MAKLHTTKDKGVYYRHLVNGERRYVIAYTDSSGRYVFKTVAGNQKDAKIQRDDILGRMHKGGKVVASKITMEELCDIYYDTATHHLRPNTRQTYFDSITHYIIPFLGQKRVADLKVIDVARMISDLQKRGLAAWTISGVLTPLSRMMVLATREGWAATNPVMQLDKSERPKDYRKPMRILNRDEIHLMLQNALPASEVLLATAVFTGLRQGELFRLEWDDINFDKSTLVVRQSKTEAGTGRIVNIPDFLLQRLAARALESDSKTVFQSGNIRARTWASNARRELTTALTRAGIGEEVEKKGEKVWKTGVRFHDLRHTFASILISQGHDVTYLANQMGHANAAITLSVYAKLYDMDRRLAEGRKLMEQEYQSILTSRPKP